MIIKDNSNININIYKILIQNSFQFQTLKKANQTLFTNYHILHINNLSNSFNSSY